MQKLGIAEILKTAGKMEKEEKEWHFHILTPGCVFNKDKRFALILENTSDSEQFVHFSMKKPSETGQKLVELLHGTPKKSFLLPRSTSSRRRGGSTGLEGRRIPSKTKKMIERATELNLKGFAWHHHVLFPDCMFNKDSRYWTLVFENPLDNEVIEERFKKEPIEALSQIEPLYYAQKK